MNVWILFGPLVVIVPPVQDSAGVVFACASKIGWNVPGMLACAADSKISHGATT